MALIRRVYKGTVLCPFPWCEEELQFELSKIFTRLTIVRRKKERAKLTKDPVKMTEVLRPYKICECGYECKCEREKPRVVLIEGEPGIGKTTSCQKLAYDWSVGDTLKEPSFPKVDILLRLTCRDMKTAKIEDAIEDQLLPRDVNEKDKEIFFYFIRHYQSRILLVLDGLDELPQNLFEEFLPLIRGRVLPLTYLIITARHEVGINVRLHSDALFEIKGYTKEDADSYIKKYFSCHDKSKLAGELIRKINNDSQLRELTANALNTALLCLVFEDTGGRLPHNKTMLYCELVECVMRRYCSKKKIHLCDKSPIDKYMHQLNQLGKLALEALLKDQLAFTPGELESQSTEFLQLGFLSREASVSKIRPKPTYAFIHKTFQEFFAAFHLSLELETADRDQTALLTQLSPVDKYWQVWKFLITMVAGKSEETATFLVSRLWASFQCKKPRKSVKRQYTRQPLDSSDSEDDSEDDSYLARIFAETDDVSFLEKTVDAIAQCKQSNNKLSSCKSVKRQYTRQPLNSSDSEDDSEDDSKDDSEGHSEDDSRGDPHDEYDKSCRGKLFGLLNDIEVRGDTRWNEGRWRAMGGIFAETDEFSFFEKTVDTIAQCEQGNNKLSSCQIKMARTLAHCFPQDEVVMKESYLPADSSPWGSQFSLVFFEYLKGNRKLKRLVWGVSASAALADVLKASHTLTNLHLKTGWCIKSLTQALQANHTVTHLNMSLARVNDVQAKAIGESLRSNHTLTHLSIAGNRITHIGVEALAHALRSNKILKNLDIKRNNIGDEGAKVLGKGLQSNHTLTHLSIAGDRITHIGIEALADALRSNKILKNLDIGSNKIGDEGAKVLGKVLQSNHTLTHLSIAYNQITHIGIEALADALRSNKILKNLDIGSNKIGDEGAKVLGKVLQSNHTLTHLSIAFNEITHIGFEALADALKSHKTLKDLKIRYNDIESEKAEALRKVLQSNHIMTHL